MKKRFVLTATALVALGFNASSLSSFAADNAATSASQPQQQPQQPAPSATAPAAAPSASMPAAPATSNEQILETYGFIMGHNLELFSFGLSDEELAAFSRGLADSAKGKSPPPNIDDIVPLVRQFVQTRPAEISRKRLAEGKAEEEKFFAELDKKENIKKTDSGLRYEIIQPGSDAKPGPNDKVTANYTGKFIDGTVFDSTANSAPAEFGLNDVIVGWKQGVPLIGNGGKIRLYVPSKLGYGDSGRDTIPPGKALIFDIELVSFRPEQPQLMGPGQQQPQLLNPSP